MGDYIKTVAVLLPVFSALACGGMLAGLSLGDSLTATEKKHKRIVVVYMAVVVVVWGSIFCYGYFPRVFVWLNIPCLLSFVFVPILFYRIVCFLTCPEREEHFSKFHYLAPCLIGLILLIWSFSRHSRCSYGSSEGGGRRKYMPLLFNYKYLNENNLAFIT